MYCGTIVSPLAYTLFAGFPGLDRPVLRFYRRIWTTPEVHDDGKASSDLTMLRDFDDDGLCPFVYLLLIFCPSFAGSAGVIDDPSQHPSRTGLGPRQSACSSFLIFPATCTRADTMLPGRCDSFSGIRDPVFFV